MLSANSALRRLPPRLDKKQLVFLEGICHAADIASLAYSRLQHVLTRIALQTQPGPVDQFACAAAFLDAWALADAIDRFRQLWKFLPGAVFPDPTPTEPSFEQIAQPVRDLRNVADHPAQRADYVVAERTPPLGILSWVTLLEPRGREGLTCMLRPGTFVPGCSAYLVNAASGMIPPGQQTAMIHLEAGEYRADLSAVMAAFAVRVLELETGVARMLRELDLSDPGAGSDYLIALRFRFNDDKTMMTLDPEQPIAGSRRL
jgi:hypothetical protein